MVLYVLWTLTGSLSWVAADDDAGSAGDFEFNDALDATLMAHETINAHPLVNTATTSIRADDLVRFLRATGHEPLILNVSTVSPH